MASVINALRSISSDDWWIVKIGFFAFFVFMVIQGKEQLMKYTSNMNLTIFILFVIMFGCSVIAMNRNINNKTPLFPSFFNMPEVIYRAVCSLLIMLPGSVIFYFIYEFIHKNLSYDDIVMKIIYGALILFILPCILIPVVLYTVRGKIKDALKLKLIFDCAGNFIFQILNFFFQSIFLIFVPAFLVYKLISEMFGDNAFISILFSIVIVITFFAFFIFLSDLYGEIIPDFDRD